MDEKSNRPEYLDKILQEKEQGEQGEQDDNSGGNASAQQREVPTQNEQPDKTGQDETSRLDRRQEEQQLSNQKYLDRVREQDSHVKRLEQEREQANDQRER